MLRTESLRASETHTPKDSLCPNKKSSGMFKNNPEQISQRHRKETLFLHSSIFFSSRLYCRLRSFTESCLAARGMYDRRDFHPALKILFIYETSICVCQRFVKLFFAKHIKILLSPRKFQQKKNTAFLAKIHRVPFYFSVTEMLIVCDAPSASPWKSACISPSLPTCSRKSA